MKHVVSALFVVAVVVIVFALSSCGNDWNLKMKNYESNYGGLQRTIQVYTITGTLITEIKGKVYFENKSGDSGVGDVAIYDVNTQKKVDIIGNAIVIAKEE